MTVIFRFTRSLASLAILIVAYWLYALIAVPIIEPAARASQQKAATAEQIAGARDARSHERKQLERWFPPGSWELTTEMVLETPRGKLLLKDYETLPGGWLKFRPCTMVFLPDAGQGDPRQPSQPVILQVPEGAELQFDETLDLGKGKIGNLVAGKLLGRFTIRSDQKQPGPEDDLLIVARDAELKDNRVVSPYPIEFRLGPNQGSGSDVEIDLGAGTIGGKKEEGGLRLEGIKSFTLKRDVIVLLDAGRGSLLGGLHTAAPGGPAVAAAVKAGPPSAPPPAARRDPFGATDELPLRIACQGPFRFNMVALEASFEDRVDVLRLNSGGQSDRLQCQRLSMFFAPAGAADPSNPAGGKSPALGKLQPSRLEAHGHPVTVESPADDVEAVGEILRYDLRSREVSLEGEHPVMLRRGPNRITAPRVEFKPSDDGRFGTFSAGGPGKMEGVAPDDPLRKFAASWKQRLSFGPDGPNHVFSLRGDARAEMLGYGGIEAEEIHVWLFEKPRDIKVLPAAHRAARPAPAAGQFENLPFAPQRMMAAGNVRLDALQLTGRVGEMQVWFKPAPPVIGKLADGSPVEELPAPPGARRAAPPQLGGLNSRQRFNVTGGLLQAEVLVGPSGTQLGKLRIHEHASVLETQTQVPGERPLAISGSDIDYEQTDPTNGLLVVTGEPAPGKPAHIEGRGLTLDGGTIRMDRGRNELLINGPGALTVPAPNDLQGRPAANAQSLGVRWQRGLIFDGYVAHFAEKVICDFDNHQLRTEQLDVTFSSRVNFASSPGQTQPEMSAVACLGPVTLDGRTYNNGQQASLEHMQAFDLTYDRASGAIHARGPGEMTMVRRGAFQFAPGGAQRQVTGLPVAPPPRSGPPVRNISTDAGGVGADGGGADEELPTPTNSAAAAAEGFSYVHIEFPTELRGNFPTAPGDSRPRVVQFSERVKTTYGPVAHWNAKIDPDDVDRQLTGDTAPKSIVLMNSNLLTVTVLPPGAAGPQATELEASGNVNVEGINFEKQNFFARADRLSYTDVKDLLILQGDGRTPAELARQEPYGTAAGRKIFFWPGTNRIKVDGAQSIDFSLPTGS